MYSIVMLAAMTTAPESPDFFFKNKGGGCCGGYVATGCCGGYYAGGCCGGYYSHGCCGGWYAGGCCGGYYGGHRFHHQPTVYGCCGGYSASCYGGYAYGGGCGGYQLYAPVSGYTLPNTPDSYIPASGGQIGTPGGQIGNPGTGTPGAGTPGSPGGAGTSPMSYRNDSRAEVVVRAPADAKLFAEGQPTNLTGAERVFQTPELAPGRDFQYTLTIEVKDGTETKSTTKTAVVRAGGRTVVDFTTPAETVTSPVSVTLPAKAKLFVDGTAAATSAGTHTFRTPELTKGKPYAYQFKAEVEVDGRVETRNREVSFTAGEPIVVDFTDTAVRTAAK